MLLSLIETHPACCLIFDTLMLSRQMSREHSFSHIAVYPFPFIILYLFIPGHATNARRSLVYHPFTSHDDMDPPYSLFFLVGVARSYVRGFLSS